MNIRKASWVAFAVLYMPLLLVFAATYAYRVPMQWLAPLIGTDFYRSIYESYLSIKSDYSALSAEQFVTLRLLAMLIVPLVFIVGLPFTSVMSRYIADNFSFRRVAALLGISFFVIWPSLYLVFWAPDALSIGGGSMFRVPGADGALAFYWFIIVAMTPVFALLVIWCGMAVLRVGWSASSDGQ